MLSSKTICLSRRQLLAGMVTSGLTCSYWSVFGQARENSTKTGLHKIKAVVKFSGEVQLKSQLSESVDAKGQAKIAKNAPMQATTKLEFEELSQYDSGLIDCMSYINIIDASSEVQVDRHLTKTKLRDHCREIVRVSRTSKRMVTSGLDHPLFSAEVNLIEIPVVPTFLDEIVTKKQVKITDKWTLSDALTSRLLAVDTIKKGTLVACLIDANKETAKIELKGTIEATVAAIPTVISVEGKAELDRAAGTITWFVANIEETRNVSERSPGYKVLAQVELRRMQLDALSNGETMETITARIPIGEAAGLRQFQSDLGHFRFIADNKWVTYRDNGEEAIYRFIVDNQRLAQCNVTNMVDYEPGRQLSLEGFVADVQTTLASAKAQITETAEQITSSKLRALRVVSQGTFNDLSVVWIHYHLSNDDGRRAVMAFMLNAEDLDTFGSEDSQIVSAFQLINWPKRLDSLTIEKEIANSAAEEATEPKSKPAKASTLNSPKISR